MIRLLKTDDIHKTVIFCILTSDTPDRNWDVITSEEIIKTAHDFGVNMQNKFLNADYEENTEIEKTKYQFVENFIALNDIIVWETIVKKWSWYVGVNFLDNELYKSVKVWEFVWVSMEWYFIV